MMSDFGSGEVHRYFLLCFPTHGHDLFPCISVLCLCIYMPVYMHKAKYMLLCVVLVLTSDSINE